MRAAPTDPAQHLSSPAHGTTRRRLQLGVAAVETLLHRRRRHLRPAAVVRSACPSPSDRAESRRPTAPPQGDGPLPSWCLARFASVRRIHGKIRQQPGASRHRSHAGRAGYRPRPHLSQFRAASQTPRLHGSRSWARSPARTPAPTKLAAWKPAHVPVLRNATGYETLSRSTRTEPGICTVIRSHSVSRPVLSSSSSVREEPR